MKQETVKGEVIKRRDWYQKIDMGFILSRKRPSLISCIQMPRIELLVLLFSMQFVMVDISSEQKKEQRTLIGCLHSLYFYVTRIIFRKPLSFFSVFRTCSLTWELHWISAK